MIKAVVFDLDDTLFPEYDYVKSGYKAVAKQIEKKYGIDDAYDELLTLFGENNNNVFNRYLQSKGLSDIEQAVSELVEIYHTHTPEIQLSDEVKHTLALLREKGYKLGVITDGRPQGQRAKIVSLGLEGMVDKIIITDELGGKECRKPNPKAFNLMAEYFGISLNEMMYVGDNPQKDFVIGKYGVTTVRIKNNGIYDDQAYIDGVKENYSISTMAELVEKLEQNDEGDAELLEFVKSKLLQIMVFIHDVCVKEGIKYSLSGGTLIGAVRHKGFIPWDDDIDICMKREDYNRFASVINEYCEASGQFEFFLYRRTPRVKFAKEPILGDKQIGGIKIDIFLLDNLPDKKSTRKRFLLKLKVLQGMMHKGKIEWSNFSFKRRLQLFVTKALGAGRSVESIVQSYFKTSARYNNTVTRDKFISNDLFEVCDIAYHREWVEDVILSAFEDREFYIFKEYDSILRFRYGDYMQLPPKEQQVHHHDFTVTPIENCEVQN
ncbi:MAG: HAD-IA family hydrolase [Clostridiales bacterium]|nr:HAD-IA family hydrolase [Clostridiales bacterium]